MFRSWKKISGVAGKFEALMWRVIVLLLGLSLGVGYVTRRDVVFYAQSPVLGYVLIVCVVMLVMLYIRNFFRGSDGS